MSETVGIAGPDGPLVARVAAALREAGHPVVRVQPRDGRLVGPTGPVRSGDAGVAVSTLVCFPFAAPSSARAVRRELDARLRELERVLAAAMAAGVRRVILRSHALAYGVSHKNYGLMTEDRATVEASASPFPWREAEQVLEGAISETDISSTVLRLTNVLHEEEGDFLVRLLGGRVVYPWAGYDPRVQFITLEDAARGFVAAVSSESAGIFNVAPPDTVSLRDVLRSTADLRMALPGIVQRPPRRLARRVGLGTVEADELEQLRYNFTVSPRRAMRELGYTTRSSALSALRGYLRDRGSGVATLRPSYDEFGLDEEYLGRWEWWFAFLRRLYWRVEFEGIENVPATGGALLVSNHRGLMPFDGVVHRSLIQHQRGRHIRFLIIASLARDPFLHDFMMKQGGVLASQSNARRLLQRGDLVGIFPEGIRGAFRLYRNAYTPGSFGRDAFAQIAIENQVPIVPAAVVGHAEIFPIFHKIQSSWFTRKTGWPAFPITATFPLLPVPLPTKWHIRYLEPVSVDHLAPEDAADRRAVREVASEVKRRLQRAIDDLLERRRHVFFGNIFDKTSARVREASSREGG
jgi:1-acyl-sn-glycerol-3-phosphate acyltransferase/nucleoside-diphosphate-sugar epimerase